MTRLIVCISCASFALLAACVSLDKPAVVEECIATGCKDEPLEVRGGARTGGKTATTGGSQSMGGMVTGGTTTTGGIVTTGGSIIDAGKPNIDASTGEVPRNADAALSAADGIAVDKNTTDLPKGTDTTDLPKGTDTTDLPKGTDTTPVLDGSSTQDTAIPPIDTAPIDTAPTPTVPPAIKLLGAECTTSQIRGKSCSESTTCYAFCGPDKQGGRKVTCKNGKFVEGKCLFSTTTNYACYKITSVTKCNNDPPKIGDACDEPICQPCGHATEISFREVSGTESTGYCVCTNRKWSCGAVTTNSWPCTSNSPKTGC